LNIKELFEKYNLTSEKEDTKLKTILTERQISKIDTSPFYQRNYVWNNEKQTYFIDSILLGVPIPPIIRFQASGGKKEVIDGKQRFETLKLFRNNKIKLKKDLISERLEIKPRTSFDNLEEKIKDSFFNYTLTLFDFKLDGEPTEEEINKIKIEIFKRYNIGISSIKRSDIFKANNVNNDFLHDIYQELISDQNLLETFDNLFIEHKKKTDETIKTERKRKIIYLIASSYLSLKEMKLGQHDNVEKYFEDSFKDKILRNEDFLENEAFEAFEEFKRIINGLENFKVLIENPEPLIYETLYRSLALLDRQNINIEFEYNLIKLINTSIEEVKSYFYSSGSYRRNHIYGRFKKISEVFSEYLNTNIEISQDENYKDKIVKIDKDFEVNNPSPSNNSIESLVEENKDKKINLRPVYQRGEVLTLQTASSIIESILLGIQLPSIFTFKRKDGISEVIDGQQRLTAIFSFLELELSVDNKRKKSKRHGFALKYLKILDHLNGKTFNELDENLKDKIFDFTISVFEIKEEFNPKFNPVEMFLRLNYKPYGISQHSFELWNSYINRILIEEIKNNFIKDKEWFFIFGESSENNKRMKNEDLIVSILFLEHISKDYNKLEDTLSYSYQENKISIALKDRTRVTRVLLEIENEPEKYKPLFTRLNSFKNKLKTVLIQDKVENIKEAFFDITGQTKSRRRHYYQFYLFWLLLKPLNISMIQEHRLQIFKDIKIFFVKSKTSQGFSSTEDFKNEISKFWQKYQIDERKIRLSEDQKKR
jgi:uncharacterized protein with ParB-like and HNH nuclease domain